MERSGHHNEKDMGEIVEIRKARCREVYDLGVEDEPHLFALASGILTHNSKKAPMPESVTDRPTKAHEQVFLLSKSASYFYDAEAIAEPSTGHDPGTMGVHDANKFDRSNGNTNGMGKTSLHTLSPTRNRRSVWTLGPESFAGTHFATMPTKLVEPCILAGTSAKGCCAACGAPWERVVERESKQEQASWSGAGRENGCMVGGGHYGRTGQWSSTTETTGWQPTCLCGADIVPCTVLDCFNGAATVGVVALKHHRNYIGIDLNADYLELSEKRLNQSQPMLEGLFT